MAAVTYGLVMIAISIGYASMWIYLAAHQEELGARRQVHRAAAVDRPVHRPATPVTWPAPWSRFISPVAALIIFGLLAVYYMFEHLPSAPVDDDDARGGPDGARARS